MDAEGRPKFSIPAQEGYLALRDSLMSLFRPSGGPEPPDACAVIGNEAELEDFARSCAVN
jgi:hypothetical protein